MEAKSNWPAFWIAVGVGLAIGAAVALNGGAQRAARERQAETPEQAAAKAAEQKRYDAAVGVALAIKGAMRDPDSLVFDSLRVNDAATVVCAEYRARNGFGGMNREILVVTEKASQATAAAWNRHCLGMMPDMLFAARAVIR